MIDLVSVVKKNQVAIGSPEKDFRAIRQQRSGAENPANGKSTKTNSLLGSFKVNELSRRNHPNNVTITDSASASASARAPKKQRPVVKD